MNQRVWCACIACGLACLDACTPPPTQAPPVVIVTPAPPPPPVAADEADAGSVTTLDEETYRRLLAKLVGYPADRIGAVGGGPVLPAPDTLLARELVRGATDAQLDQLLHHPRAAVRAHAAREIVQVRPADAARLRGLFADRAPMRVGSMADTPPLRDEITTVGALARGLLQNCYACPPR